MNQFNSQMLKKAFAPIVQEISAPLLEPPAEILPFSSDFEKKIKTLFRIKPQKSNFLKPLIVGTIALFLSFNIFLFSVAGLRNRAYQFLIKIYEHFSVITVEKSQEKSQEKPQEFIAIEPNYLPENYKKTAHRRYNGTYQTIYQNKDGDMILLHQTSVDSMNILLDESENAKTVQVGSYFGLIQTKTDTILLIFSDEKNIFHLEAPLSEEEIIKIGQSLCE